MEDEMVSKRLLNISEVSARLNVPLSRCYEMARSGLLPTVRLGRQIRVDPDGLQDWIARVCARPAYQRAKPQERMRDLLS